MNPLQKLADILAIPRVDLPDEALAQWFIETLDEVLPEEQIVASKYRMASGKPKPLVQRYAVGYNEAINQAKVNAVKLFGGEDE